MTDQRPIDPSALRDGDIVRAKRGEHGVVEGVFCRTGRGGWCLHDGPTSARETAWSADCWTITSIIRPVLVKGDRVTLNGEIGTYRGDIGGDTAVVHFERNGGQWNGYWPKTEITRLPAAPEPAPIEVGGYILAADHDRIVAEAEARGWNKMVEAAIKAVDDVYPVSDQWGHHTLPHIDRRQARAAITALRKPEVEG